MTEGIAAQPTTSLVLRRAILYMFAGTFCFALYDATGKWLTAGYSVWQILSLSRVLPTLVMIWLIYQQGFKSTLAAWRHHLWRSLCIVGTAVAFFLSVTYIPLAQAIAICFLAPIFIVLLAGPVLGEKVPSQAWIALLLAFVGSMIIVRPGLSNFHLASLFALTSALLYAGAILFLRLTPTSQSMRSIIFFNTTAMCLLPAPLAAWQWHSPSLADLGLMIGMGGIGFIAQYFINEGYRGGTAARIAPIEYMALPYSILFGFILWGDKPSLPDLAGAAMILAANFLMAKAKQA